MTATRRPRRVTYTGSPDRACSMASARCSRASLTANSLMYESYKSSREDTRTWSPKILSLQVVALIGDVASADLVVGLVVGGRKSGPRAEMAGALNLVTSPISTGRARFISADCAERIL